MRPELASSGATPLCRASWPSFLKRSIGPISASSFAAVTAPQPGRSKSTGAVSAVRRSSSWSSSSIIPVSARILVVSSRASRTCSSCFCRASHRLTPLEVRAPGEQPQRHRERRIELVQVPTQPLLDTTTFVDEIVAGRPAA